MLDIQQDPFYNEVEWFDTDASEDEDFLPPRDTNDALDRKRNRMNSLSWDINTREMFRRKLTISTETPLDKVRRAIDKTIDYGVERVDISHVELTEIPDEIEELQYVTIVQHDIVKAASLQLFLYGNYIESINLRLFRLKNLSVLSLRNNRLRTIPPEIALLENLVELSLGNNQLKSIPAELLRLKKLELLSLLPNPFLALPNDKSHRQIINQHKPTLLEIASRTLLRQEGIDTMLKDNACVLPMELVQKFRSVSKIHYCEHCKLLFHIPDIEEIQWKTVLKNHHIPVLYRFCSIQCRDIFVL